MIRAADSASAPDGSAARPSRRTATIVLPRQGGLASPSAYEITRSLIFSSTQPKFASLIEKLSKSGAGFRKSIAYRTPSRTANSTVSMS